MLVLVALVITYFVDPYIFGFTTLILGFASAAVTVLGIAVCLVGKPERSAKLAIVSFLALAGISVLGALALLRAFKWG